MTTIPRDRSFDGSLALLADGYEYISKRCQRYGSDVFATRLLLEPTICMRGAEAAKVFYDRDRFRRSDAAPVRLTKTLFGHLHPAGRWRSPSRPPLRRRVDHDHAHEGGDRPADTIDGLHRP